MTSDIAGLVVRLRHAMTTMANDDYSEVGSDKRKRHVARLDAMDKSATVLEAIGRERDEALALNNKYAWERDKAREERDAAERRSEAYWSGGPLP